MRCLGTYTRIHIYSASAPNTARERGKQNREGDAQNVACVRLTVECHVPCVMQALGVRAHATRGGAREEGWRALREMQTRTEEPPHPLYFVVFLLLSFLVRERVYVGAP